MTIGMAIVLIATVGFLIVSPGFRKVVGVIAAGAIALLALLWIVNRSIESHDRDQMQAAESLPPTEIKAQELTLANVKMERPSWAVPDGGSLDEWLLTGTVTNNSKHSLGSLIFEITVLDCPIPGSAGIRDSNSNCLSVGQRKQDTSASVPPGQTRAFSSNAISFPNMPALDQRYQRKFNWKLVKIDADPWADAPDWTPTTPK
jgi:hypothetical protein